MKYGGDMRNKRDFSSTKIRSKCKKRVLAYLKLKSNTAIIMFINILSMLMFQERTQSKYCNNLSETETMRRKEKVIYTPPTKDMVAT